jgi:hypothetical protein
MSRYIFCPIILFVLLTGCVSVGPGTLKRDHFDYTAAVGETSKEQLLRNIVRLRYLEAPVFLRVSSIINQYSLEGTVSLGGTNTDGLGDARNVGGTGRWTDRPTITYTPLSGSTFAQNLLTPIPPVALLALVQSGWSGEFLFRIAVRSINALENESAAPSIRKAADPRFRELLELWFRLRKNRVLGLRRDDEGAQVRFFGYIDQETAPAALSQDVVRLRELLGLDPDAFEFIISYGLIPDEPNEIALLTSSILEIMSELSWRVDVPAAHIEAGRTLSSVGKEEVFDWPIFHVASSDKKPDTAYVTVFERGVWFYIDDTDLVSKRTFALLQVLLSLTESSDQAGGPVVTIGS